MAKYRKKPVVIEAFLHTEDSTVTQEIALWVVEAFKSGTLYDDGAALMVKTLEGPLRVSDGDWIIRGIKGELYPCKPDIFAATYEAVE